MRIAPAALTILLTWCMSTTVPARGDVPNLRSQQSAQPKPEIKTPTTSEVRQLALDWLQKQEPSQTVLATANELWQAADSSAAPLDPLGLLAQTYALADSRARLLLDDCGDDRPLVADPQEWLADPELDTAMRDNLRLYYGRWLARHDLYDECLQQFRDLSPERVVAPAALLFYRGVAFAALVQKQPALEAVHDLLNRVDSAPERYLALARLLQAELAPLEQESLDHVARRMSDIHRRLDLGRAGDTVQEIERGVIETLDKMIEEAEKQQQQQQQAGGGSGSQGRNQGRGGKQSANPANQSRLLGGKGQGDAEPTGARGAGRWGDLPPKQRQAALQQIGRQFPAHYRDVIEQYFRSLAGDDNQSPASGDAP